MSPGKDMTALVVEDDREMAVQLKAILGTKYGLEVDVAGDCASARERLAKRYYDLVTVDFLMPDGHGLDLLQEITSADGHPPVIVITGQGAEETAARSINADACGYVVKGVRLPDMLSDAVEKGLTEVALKRVEDALREERSFAEAALDAIQDIFFVIGLRGKGLSREGLRWNARVGEVTGYTEEEIASMPPAEFFEGEDLERVMRALDEVADSGRATVEAALVTKDGRRIPYEWTAALLRDSSGSPMGSCGVGRDVTERKLAEEALRDEKAFTENALNVLPDLFAVVDSDGVFVRWNARVPEVTGYTDEELSGMRITDLFVPEHLEVMEAGMARMKEGGRGNDEVSLLAKDGRRIPFELTGMTIFDDCGNPVGFCGTGRDVSERRQTEQQLRRYRDHLEELVKEHTRELARANELLRQEIAERRRAEESLGASESHYRSLFENSLDVIAILDQTGKILDASPSIEGMFGRPAGDLVGSNVFEFFHPDDLPRLLGIHDQVVKDHGLSRSDEARFIHADGTLHTMEAVARGFLDGSGKMRIAVNARDVTDRKRAEEALQQSEERYRSIFALSPDFIFVVENSRIVAANPAVAERTGLTQDQLSGMDFMEFFAGDNLRELEAAIAELFAGREVRGLEIRARAPGGEPYWCEISATPLFQDGRLARVICLARDVTKRHEAEDELRRLNDELDGYAHTVSHDLRSPLTAIKLANETLQRVLEGAPIDDVRADTERFGEVIRLSTEKAEALIADLLSLARAGQQPEEVSEVDVREVVDRILGERLPLIQEKGVSVEVDEELGRLLADPTHVYQVFSNLVGNAIRHNDNPDPKVKIKLLGESPSSGNTYVVCDNGTGVPLEDLENIFLPFFKSEHGDTGIGLTIVDRIVKHYGGSIQAYNNHGVCFEFTLPGLPE